ncbi:MAG TPA: ATP-binding protein [Streptosporangiaceae bacterium]|nr:ATP-binding protein [Streptosporangiaceae bacterium]
MISTRDFTTGTTMASAASPADPRAPMLAVLPGTPESARAARQLARELLGDEHPAIETTMLLISELVTNSVMHSRSGEPGGRVTVVLCAGRAGILIQVSDDGGPSEPCVSVISAADAEHGYGLLLVDALAERWGSICSPEGRVTWCRVSGTGVTKV